MMIATVMLSVVALMIATVTMIVIAQANTTLVVERTDMAVPVKEGR